MGDRSRGGRTTHFGYADIPAARKGPAVRRVFDSVARRYDLMNDLMSLGVHRLWKTALVDSLNPQPDMHLLDVAGGTGDVAFRFLDRLRGEGAATVCDVNLAMMSAGRDRAAGVRGRGELRWVSGSAEALPLADGAVDAYTIAFGLRNVTDIEAALAEAWRVLRPAGRFLCLEFSRLGLPMLSTLYDRYSFAVIPRLGQAVTGDRAAYRYLVESIRRFPAQEELAEMIAAAGLQRVAFRNLSGGIAAIHSAWRI
jgi:demethylmenaquinone methyltransferase/2-methoxy-6-polyprenyl-1,4-benzoquinol methylase